MLRRSSLTNPAWLAIFIVMAGVNPTFADDAPAAKKIVLIAGKKSHGPEGNGIHDYPWSVKLLKVMLDNSNVAEKVRVEYHLDGWPEDEKTLDDAAAIMIVSDGRDGDLYEEAPHFRTEEHRQAIAKQIARGCGFLTFHFSTFAPDKFADDILSWSGGYFDWETDGKKQWYSAIKTLDADIQLATPEHSVLRGVKPFKMREEYYYNIRFGADDKTLKPLWVAPAVEGRAENGNVVAWAKERPDGGRGFGTTCGHFYDNWRQDNFRKLMLNALAWAAKVEVPENGVEAKYYTQAEITAALNGKRGTERAVVDDRPIKAMIMTGYQYPGHLWKDTTPALKEALSKDPRIKIDVSENIEDFATDKIAGYDLLVLNYCNWEKPGLSDAAKAGFVKYLKDGGGLIIIHFANGAFHFSLPKAGDSDWPEYRKICRRVWDHTPNQSGHDAYGKFTVDIAKADHPITKAMEPFETIDELYFRQQGEEPIEVLLTAKSKVTGRDEPMAFVYQYGQGRVMQTVLGHAAESLRTPGAIELIRRSAAWVAQREQTLAGSQAANPPAAWLVEGKFGKALNANRGGLSVEGHESFRVPPLTVECWAKLSNKTNYNILVAQENKNSATHWELFTMNGNGRLTAYLPGMKPDHVHSQADIVDDRWHYLAMIYQPQRVRLYVDGKQVADQAVEFQQGKTVPGGLALAQLVDKTLGCAGLIDEMRLSRGVKDVTNVPDKPFAADDSTLGLWRFEALDGEGRTPDESSHKRSALLNASAKTEPSNSSFSHWSKDVVGFDWTEKDSVDNRWNQTDVGPFLASTVPMPGQPPVTKGLSIKAGDKASVCYDTQTMALRSIWTGGFLKFDPARYGIIAPPQMDGELQFLSSPDAGWVAKSVKYLGHHLHERQLVLSAKVNGVTVRETPATVELEQQLCLLRMLEAGPADRELTLQISRAAEIRPIQTVNGWRVVSWKQGSQWVTGAIARGEHADFRVNDDRIQLIIDPRGHFLTTKLLLMASAEPRDVLLKAHKPKTVKTPAIVHLLKPGESLWKEEIVTRGTMGTEAKFYQVDTFTVPFENPYRALFFISGHDHFSYGDLAVCTVHGDVWRVITEDFDEDGEYVDDLHELHWQRFATGLFQPLGLKIVDGDVYVLGRDRITRLRDDNRDGFADRYENFCDLYETSPGGHDYVTCLETDSEGSFYFAHAKHGVQKISKDGKTLETVATGLRNPHGLSVSPVGEITAAPQEGEWTPASAIFLVRPGDHFGYGGPKIAPQRPLGYDPPLCWLPRLVDNSSGGQCWVPNDSWGLPANSLLHFSFGQCTASLALRESVDGVWQGGVIPLPWKFQSGVSRGRFNPHDGQLYVSGLKGWVTSAAQDGCLQRVRCIGGDVPWPVAMQSYRNGIAFTFGCRLDKDSAENPENYRAQACNYRYSVAYGSPDLRPSHPTVEGRDEWDVASATLLDDGKTVFLEIPDLAPVMQIIVNWSIASADQIALTNSYNGTIHRLPEKTFAVPESSRQPRPGRLAPDVAKLLQPGVQFMFLQGENYDTVSRRMFAWNCGADEPPTAFLAPGPYKMTAESYLLAPLAGTYTLRLRGNVGREWTINDQAHVGSATVRLHKGYNRIWLQTESEATGPTTLQLLWQSAAFAEEPVPPTAWFYEGGHPLFTALQERRRGRELFATYHCGRCHTVDNIEAAPEKIPAAPDLKALSGRMTRSWLSAWLLNPRAIRNTAEMPQLFDGQSAVDRQAAADLIAYLIPSDEPVGKRREASQANDPAAALYEDLGCIACHRFTPPTEADEWNRTSLAFTAGKFPGTSLTQFLREPQRHFPRTRMPDFRLNAAEANALSQLIRVRSTGALMALPELNNPDAERGRIVFAQKRCGHCHGSEEPKPSLQPLLTLSAEEKDCGKGCLAGDKALRGSAPVFSLSEDDRRALCDFLTSTGRKTSASVHEQTVDLTKRLNCVACHHRDRALSPRGEIIAVESERGIPPEALPNLTFAGEKLQAEWMRQLFRGEQPRNIRPWLKARMPAFPAYAAELAAGLAAEHGLSAEPEPSLTIEKELAEIGRRLAQKDQGLDCRQCHAVAGQQPTGDDKTKIAPGIDFAATKQRMRGEFYRRFVLDPPRFDVTIRMPKFALDGKTTQAVQILDGDAAKQFEALWHYIHSLPDVPREK